MYHKKLYKIADEYFDFMASNYPVMTFSDEFYFMPRAESSIRYLHLLELMDKDAILHTIKIVKGFKKDIENLVYYDDIELTIDKILLIHSIISFIYEFERLKRWRWDATLYLKIMLYSIQQLHLIHFCKDSERKDFLDKRLLQIPILLKNATKNIEKIPADIAKSALQIIASSFQYFSSSRFLSMFNKRLHNIQKVLDVFKEFVTKRADKGYNPFDLVHLEYLVCELFLYSENLRQLYKLVSEEYRYYRHKLRLLCTNSKPVNDIRHILQRSYVPRKDRKNILEFYKRQIFLLRRFIEDRKLLSIPKHTSISVEFTPLFLIPIRPTASYNSSVDSSKRGYAIFYISPNMGNIHNEYIFITAHETYPGHHLLDTVRKHQKDAIRRQIEFPLFYEGWASYVESLLIRYGYIKDKIHLIFGTRRRAWRALRAMIEIGTRINKLTFNRGAEMLLDLGYSYSSVKTMIEGYLMSFGYQLCYTLGNIQLDKLWNEFSGRMDIKAFHNIILTSGEAPFYLVRRRLRKFLSRSDDN